MGILDILDAQQRTQRPASSAESSTMQALLQQARQRHAEQIAEDDDEEDYYEDLDMSSSPARRGYSRGFSLRPHHEDPTPLRMVDVGGVDQQRRMAEFVANTIENLSHGLTVKKAMKELHMDSPHDLLHGMEVRLLTHQIIGVSWMVQQEKVSPHKGGILADDMGLGKTVQLIACMAINMPSLTDEHRTTLIVVPAALMYQWKEEIETKTNDLFTIHIHHGKDKLKRVSEVKKFDVVITTYQTLSMDFATPSNVDPDDEMAWLSKNGGVLARCKYYRAVADEAQFIRNRATRSSTALAMVRAKYRWMLTGTPVTNSLADIYGLLRFGHFRPWNDWGDYNDHVVRVQGHDAPLAGSRAQAILAPLMLRRMKTTLLDGKPIFELPTKYIDFVTTEFSQDERALYDHFEKTTQLTINKFIKAGTLLKNHHVILLLILRLRQMCNHPSLVLAGTVGDPTLLVKDERDREYARAIRAMGSKWVDEVRKEFSLRKKLGMFEGDEGSTTSTCPVCKELYEPGAGRILKCKHELCFDCLTDLSESAITHDGVFGEGTEQQNLQAEKAWEEADKKGWRPCPTCKQMQSLKPNDVFKSIAFELTDDDLQEDRKPRYTRGAGLLKRRRAALSSDEDDKIPKPSPSFQDELEDSDDDLPDPSQIRRPSLKKQKVEDKPMEADSDMLDITMGDITAELPPINGSASQFRKLKSKVHANSKDNRKQNNDDDGRPDEAIWKTWKQTDDDVEPSAKMLSMIELLASWDTTHPDDKVIVYSQWTSMLNLVEVLFHRHGIRSLRYDGSMNREERERAIKSFKSLSGPKIILISTKCGGVGLNLVAANRVINLDVSWNYAAESQAYDRVHRLGQDKEVFVKRLIVRDTIEERMLKLQEVKTGLSDAALGEGSGAKLSKLSVKDIKLLFGMSRGKDEERQTLED